MPETVFAALIQACVPREPSLRAAKTSRTLSTTIDEVLES